MDFNFARFQCGIASTNVCLVAARRHCCSCLDTFDFFSELERGRAVWSRVLLGQSWKAYPAIWHDSGSTRWAQLRSDACMHKNVSDFSQGICASAERWCCCGLRCSVFGSRYEFSHITLSYLCNTW
jgi:hypothetical protein